MTAPKNRLKYDTQLLDVYQNSEGPLALGTRIVEVRKMMGIRSEIETVVDQHEHNRVVGYRSLKSDPMGASGYYQFEDVPEGTQLTLKFIMNPRGVLKLAKPLIAVKLKSDIQRGLTNIKDVLEGEC